MNTIYKYCQEIDNGRTWRTAYEHMQSEVEELYNEYVYINRKDSGLTAITSSYGLELGEDGVVGEAVDVALCAFDIAYMKLKEEGLSHDEIVAKIEEIKLEKLEKWKRMYPTAEKKV